MGLFSRKDRIYPLKKAIDKLKTPEYKNYTAMQVGNGYKLITLEEASKHIEQIKNEKQIGERQINEQRRRFLDAYVVDRVNVRPNYNSYPEKNKKQNYNNWQAAKSYQKQMYNTIEDR